jgi:hypothetical protein
LKDVLKTHKPSEKRDDDLWEEFVDQFRSCLKLSSLAEDRRLHGLVHNKPRKIGESIYGFAPDFRMALRAYHDIIKIKIPDADAVHLVIMALNLDHPPMYELHLRLLREEEEGSNLRQLITTISRLPNVAGLVQMEKTVYGGTGGSTPARTHGGHLRGPPGRQ